MAKRLTLCGVLFLLAALAAFAGDVAQFVNLGFSPDSKYFMFGQYGIREKSSYPWAETYIVDVAANAFAPRGAHKVSYSQPIEPGVSGMGALLNALADSIAEKKQYKIDHLLSGRLLYILVDGAPANDTLEFRDFPTGRTYRIALVQAAVTQGSDTSSSFHLSIAVEEKGGRTYTLSAGDALYKRPGVKGYAIKQIVGAPDGSSLVFVIQKEEKDASGSNVRFMVETVRVK